MLYAKPGKTTILKGILDVYEQVAGLPVSLCALSGRASQRMAEATGRPACTIAKLIIDQHSDNRLPEHCLVALDEGSMVDLHTTYRLFRLLIAISGFLVDKLM